jgi:predicted membrane channel-forming protein YqfA (hemolysin III family)
MFKEQTMSNEAKGMALIMTSIILALGLVGSLQQLVDISAEDATILAMMAMFSIVSGLLGLSYLER